ncbi:MAG: hypothetical protein GXP62_15125, partial [Oligoflexia bacterium]|nr:hypothetical protein [Oligoflexia bacterium]
MRVVQAAALMLVLGGCSDRSGDTGTATGPWSSGNVRSASDAAQATWTGSGPHFRSGVAVATGFVDGTGSASVIIGAPSDGSYEGDGPIQGFAYLVSASADGAGSVVDATATVAVGDAGIDGFGGALATGDVNGDGIDDLVGGAEYSAADGSAYLLLGPV